MQNKNHFTKKRRHKENSLGVCIFLQTYVISYALKSDQHEV